MKYVGIIIFILFNFVIIKEIFNGNFSQIWPVATVIWSATLAFIYWLYLNK